MTFFTEETENEAPAALEDLVPALRLMPGEDHDRMHSMRDQLLAELAPRTGYEQIVAGNLVSLELENVRLRRMRDELLMNAMIDATERALSQERLQKGVLEPGDDGHLAWDSERDFEAWRLEFHCDRSGKKLSAFIKDHGYDEMAILAEASASSGGKLYPFDAQIAMAEPRRHRLLADYHALRKHNDENLIDVEIGAEAIRDL